MKFRSLLTSRFGSPNTSPPWRKRLTFGTHRIVHRLGIPGILAIGALVFCAMIWGSAILPQHTQFQALVQDLQSVSSQPTGGPGDAEKWQGEITTFRATFPDKSRLVTLIGQLHTHAEAAGIHLASTEFRLVEPETTSSVELPTILVTVETNASHEQTIKFVNLVLVEMPNSALEAVSLKRGKLLDAVLETQLRFRFYVRAS